MVSIIWSRRLQYLFIAIVTVTVGFSLYQWNASRAALKVNTSQNFNANGLVGHWTFDGADTVWTSSTAGTTLDDSGNGNTGTLTNMNRATSPIDGKTGQALSFTNTTTTLVSVPGNTDLDIDNTESLSVSLWFKSYGTSGASRLRLFGHGNPGYGCFQEISTQTIACRVRNVSLGEGTTPTYTLNEWHHLVYVIDGTGAGTGTIYLDGTPNTPVTLSDINPSNPGNAFIIGDDGAASGVNWNGAIDDVRVYNRALPASEITALRISGKALINTSQDSNLTKGLAGYWKFDEGSGTNANDSSVNGNTGTLVSTPTWTTGQINGGLTFNGANYVSTTQTPLTSTVPNGFSVFVWLQSPNADAWAYDMGGSSALNLMTSATGTYCRIRDTSLGFFSTPRSTINGDGNWHNFGCIFNRAANVLTLYVDGVSSGTVSTSGFTAFDNGGAPFYLGGRSYASGGINGSLDEVRIYDRALSADEANQIYSLTTPTGVDTGLKGHWSFDGADVSGTTAYDRSGAGNNGTLTNSPTITEGKLGQALNLGGGTGTGKHIDFGSAISVDNIETQTGSGMTVSAWIKPQSFGGYNVGTIVAKATDPDVGGGHWSLSMSNTNGVKFEKGYSTTLLSVRSNDSITMNKWQHILMTWDGTENATNVHIYMNGIESNYATRQSGVGTKGSDAGMNLFVGGEQRFFDGAIDDVRIYNRVLSAGEIQSLYNFGSSDKVNSSASQNQGTGRLDSGLTEYWKFDDGSGTSVTDSSVNANNGTLTGGTLPTWGTGYIGGGLDFNGTTGAYVLGPSSYTGFNNNYTISVWVKSTDVTTNEKMLVATYNGFGATSEKFFFKKEGITQKVAFSSIGGATSYTYDVTNGNWHHLVATRTIGGVETLYADGIQIGQNVTTTGTLTMAFGNTTLRIGGSDTSSMNGSLDEVRIYDRALSADEISQLYRLTTPTGTDTSLKGYWSFNGSDLSGTTAYDRSGSGNNGTTSGATITEGRIGQALSFDGVDDLINMGSPASLDNIMDFSYSAWVNVLGAPKNARGRIFAKNTTGSNDTGVSLEYDTGAFHGDMLKASVGFNTTDAVATSQNLWNITGGGNNYTGGWQYVVMTFDGASKVITLYLNGVEVSYQTHTTGVGTRDDDSAENFHIGNNIFGQRTFNGKIDEPRVYNRVLSAGEVSSLYNSSR